MFPGDHLVRLDSSGSSRCALMVAWFVWVCLLRSGASLGSLVFYCFVWFAWVHPGGRCVGLGSSYSCGCALSVAGFIWMGLLCLVAAWGAQGSFDSSGCALCVAAFFDARLVHPGAP